MDKEIRLGRFDKWGYKNSFSKGELARELTYMNRDYDNLERQCKKQKEVIDKAIEFTNKNWSTWCSNHYGYMTELQNILNEVSE